jgi:hypothetical protein
MKRKPPLSTDSRRILSRASAKPDLSALRSDLASALVARGTVQARQDAAQRVRFNEWEGQSDDFRKHAEDLGRDALPFEGAADTRPLVVDAIVNERAALMLEALMAAEMQAQPLGADDAEAATRMTRLLRHTRETLLADELEDEAELLAQYQEGDDPGIGILKVAWKRQQAVELRTLTLQEVSQQLLALRGLALPEDPEAELDDALVYAVDDITDTIFNPLRAEEALAMLRGAYPTVQAPKLRRALRDLQRSGTCRLPVVYVKESRPSVCALRYMEDVVFPADVDDIQRTTPHEYLRLSEVELRREAENEGWGEDFVDEVLAAGPGPSEAWAYGRNLDFDPTFGGANGEREIDNLYEVILSHTRACDDYGIPGVYLTVWSAKVRNVYGKHELTDYPDGDFPYVLFRAERIGRGVYMSRGVPLVAGAAQHELKVQRDCRTDYTQITTIPPVKVRQRRGGLEMALGPMVEVPVRDADDVTWMNPPPFPQMSIEVERATRNDLNEYFGRLVADVPPELRQALLQKKVNTWLRTWRRVWRKVVGLLQEFMEPLELELVTGGGLEPVTREEVSGRFRLLLQFSVADLNLEFVMKRLDAVGKLAPYNIDGTLDFAAILRFGLRGIDPTLAEVGLRDAGTATAAEVRDEINAVAQMAQGIEPQLAQQGVNARLRLRTLEETIGKSPVLMRRLMQPATPDDELFATLVETRRKNLGFLVEQVTTNAAAGRAGAKPVLG